jgi:hypothetical protein
MMVKAKDAKEVLPISEIRHDMLSPCALIHAT